MAYNIENINKLRKQGPTLPIHKNHSTRGGGENARGTEGGDPSAAGAAAVLSDYNDL